MALDSRRSNGICKLTLRPGQFVKSHIIPESLTRPSIRGNPLYQYGGGSGTARPVKRWSSWYDGELVTEEGERCLSELDNWAVRELRRHQLIWSGWGDRTKLPARNSVSGPGSIGIRKVDGIDSTKLRRFFLSLLWRAAATTLEEFSEIVLSSEDLERLRLMVLSGDVEPLSFYPCQLTQISTKGVIHNHAAIGDLIHIPNLISVGAQSRALPTYRFYFDGLIAHMAVSLLGGTSAVQLGNLIVGGDKSLVLSTVSFEDSLQRMHLRAVVGEHGAPMLSDASEG